MSLFRHPSAAKGMSSYNESDNVMYMLTEEHRKPNIIRSSGTKSTKGHHHPMLEPDLIKTEPLIDNISSTDTVSEDLQRFEEEQLQLSNSLQSVVVSTEDMHNFQQQLILEPKIEEESPEHSLIEAAIQTPEGNYMILIKGNEIVSAHEINNSNYSEDNEQDQFSAAITNDSFDMETQNEQTSEDTEILSEPQFTLYQLPNGETILIQGSFDEGHQMIINENQEFIQVLGPTVQSDVMSEEPAGSLKGTKPRKRCNTEQQIQGSSPPKKTYSNVKKLKKSCPSTKLMPPVVNQGNPMSNLYQQQQLVTSNPISNNNMMREDIQTMEQAPLPLIELKPKPFRFDIPESEANGLEDNNFLSLVIENFQTQLDDHSAEEDKKPDISILSNAVDPLGGENIINEKGGLVLIARTEQCPKCSFKGTDRKSLAQHVSRFHNEDLPYTCSHCGQKFTYDFQLTSHSKIHHGISQEQALSCKLCGKQFQIESALSFHKRSCSSNKDQNIENKVTDVVAIPKTKVLNRRKQTVYSRGIKDLPCEEDSCYKWFNDKYSLIRHQINVHLTTPPFKCGCDMCEKTFDNKEAYLSHLACHEDGIARPFECQRCQKCFKMESHLIGHMRAHIQKDLTENAKLRDQELLKHPEKLMELAKISYRNKPKATDGSIREVFCQICDDIFPNKQALDNHKTSKHGDVSPISGDGPIGKSNESKEDTFKAFDSITEWRRHVQSESQNITPPSFTSLPVGGRHYRDVTDVQNDFKNLSNKILVGSKDTINETKTDESTNQVTSKVQTDIINDSLNKEKPDEIKKPNVVPLSKDAESKKNETAATTTAPVEEIESHNDEQSLSNDSISSIVNHMRSRMVTRGGIKTLRAESPTREKHLPVKKRKQMVVNEHVEVNVSVAPAAPRELRSRGSKSNDEVKSQLSEIKTNKLKDGLKLEDTETKKVGKRFVSIFQKVKKQQEQEPERSETSVKPITPRTRTRK